MRASAARERASPASRGHEVAELLDSGRAGSFRHTKSIRLAQARDQTQSPRFACRFIRTQIPHAALTDSHGHHPRHVRDLLRCGRKSACVPDRLSLGTELDEVNRNELIERVQQLEQRNTTLDQQLSEANDRITAFEGQLRGAEDDPTAARASLRRAMRAVPSP